MKRSLYLFSILFIGLQVSAEAQILKKIGKAVKQAAEEVLEEELGTTVETVAHPGPAGENTRVIKPGPSTSGDNAGTATAEMEVKNFFEAGTRKEVYGEVGAFIEVSPDKAFIAHSGFQGTRPVLLINGKPGPEFDDIPDAFRFSPQGGHYAYVGKRGGKCILVVDGEEGEPTDCANLPSMPTEFWFTSDGKKLVYKELLEQYTARFVINGEKGAQLGKHQDPVITNEDVYYLSSGQVYKNNQAIEGIPPAMYDSRGMNLKVTADGSQYAYFSLVENKYYIVVNGKKVAGPYHRIRFRSFNDAGVISYFAEADYKPGGPDAPPEERMFWKDREFAAPSGERFVNGFQVNSDGTRFSYCTEAEGGQRVWWNGAPGPFYEKISDLQFSPDGRKFLFLAHTGGKIFLVVDGQELGPFDNVEGLQFSEYGNAFTFLGRTGNETYRYVNGTEIKLPEKSNSFTFSPDGRRYAYVHDRSIVVDGKATTHPSFENHIGLFGKRNGLSLGFVFSPDGNRLAYSYRRYNEEQKKTELVLLLDNQEFSSPFPNKKTFGNPVFSPDGSHFAFLSPVRGENNELFWRLILDMKPGPVIGAHQIKLGNPKEPVLLFKDKKTLYAQGYMNNQIVAHTISLE